MTRVARALAAIERLCPSGSIAERLATYERLVAKRSPERRRARGGYVTPPALASFLARAADFALRRLGAREGLATPGLVVVDPAAGTGALLEPVLDLFPGGGAPRLVGLELDALAVSVAKAIDPRLKNRLFARDALRARALPRAHVVLANPPYGPRSRSAPRIDALVSEYREGLRERKSDVGREEWRFVRLAEELVRHAETAVLALVLNRSFLDGVTFRVLRRHLAERFPLRFVVDLGGDVKSRGASIELDESLFAIAQGTAVAIFGRAPRVAPELHLLRLEGSAAEKSSALERPVEVTFASATRVLSTPGEAWVPTRAPSLSVEKRFSLAEIFVRFSSGVQTGRDALTIAFTEREMKARVLALAKLGPARARARFDVGPDTSGWSLTSALRDLRATGPDLARVGPLLYRPFDLRATYFTDVSMGFLKRPRAAITRALRAPGALALVANRQVTGPRFSHVAVTRVPACHGTFYLGNRGQDYVFPLALSSGGSNLSPTFIDAIGAESAREAFDYVVAILHAPWFRAENADELRRDFARIPIRRHDLRALARAGARLVQAHTLDPSLGPLKGARFVGEGRGVAVVARRDDVAAINETSRFDGIPGWIWDYEVGGYPALAKWLEARRRAARDLDDEDVEHVLRVARAIEVMEGEASEIEGGTPRERPSSPDQLQVAGAPASDIGPLQAVGHS